MKGLKWIAAIWLLCITACMKEDDASDIVLFVTPSAVEASSGEKIMFEIETWTIHDRLASVTISSFDAVNGLKPLFAETELSSRYSGRYMYDVPEIENEKLKTDIIFSVKDTDGHVKETKIQILIMNGGAMLPELTAITLYSDASGKQDAFSLSDLQAITSSVAGEEKTDIYVYPSTDPEILSREWRTKTGVRFVRANQMDYPSVTKSKLNAMYTGSQKEDHMTGIADNDIIIVGREENALGVFKVISVFDEEGSANDRFIVNFKNAGE